MNISEFNWKELCSNDTGKTSMSALMGGLTVLCSCIGFIIGCISKNNEILTTSSFFIAAGCGLLGVRKFMNNKETITDVPVDTAPISEDDK